MRALNRVPVAQRVEATATQFVEALKASDKATVVYQSRNYTDRQSVTGMLVGMPWNVCGGYSVIVCTDSAKPMTALVEIPLTALISIEAAKDKS
jgi:hypothetical protein